MKRTFIALAAGLLIAAALQAHDFWIEPSAFHPPPGAVVSVSLRVGEHFAGDPVPHSPQIEKFVLIQNGREREISGQDGRDPAGWIQIDGRSPAVIAYRSKPSYVELPAGRFESYLREHGLERILALRARRGERSEPGRELFSRCAKSLLNGSVTRPAALPYEIVPEDASPSVAPFRGRVLYEGKPLAGALVVATWRDDPRVRLKMRSNAEGRFAFSSPRRGVWLITSVHMIEASRFAKADWESLWASMTFEVR